MFNLGKIFNEKHKINESEVSSKSVIIEGNNISIVGTKVYSDGKRVALEGTELNNYSGPLEVIIKGNVQDITCDGNVTVNGNVSTKVTCDGSVFISGDVDGTIIAEGSVNIQGTYAGPIRSEGYIVANNEQIIL